MLISMIGAECIFLTEVDSTNNYTAKLITSGFLRHGTVILADRQTAGRGQRGNTWQSGATKQFTASYFLQTAFLSVEHAAFLNKAMAVGVAEAVSRFVESPVKVKWPNDILINNKKIGGILIEGNVKASKLEHIILGIGINLEQEEDLPLSTSFEREGVLLDARTFLQTLNATLQLQFEKIEHFRFSEIQEEYLQHLWRLKAEQLITRQDGKQFRGAIVDVDSEGSVVIESQFGLETFGLQEVKFNY